MGEEGLEDEDMSNLMLSMRVVKYLEEVCSQNRGRLTPTDKLKQVYPMSTCALANSSAALHVAPLTIS